MEHPTLRESPPRRLPVAEVVILPIRPVDAFALEQIVEALRLRRIMVKTERPILRPRGAYDARRRQFRAEVLLERVALADARPVLGVTDADCYAGNLNFVFGIAEIGAGTAVVSLHRLQAGVAMSTFLARAMKEVFHELGHARGLGHCANARCVMHFSNSLAETDAKDEQLCATCMQRLRQ